MNWRTSFAPLREANFAWYYAANFVNIAGSMMAGVALTFAVLDHITHSPTALGQVLAAHTIPMVVFLLFGGVIADRLPRTLILQVSNVLSALTQGIVAWLVLTDRAELWMIIVLEAVNGTVSSVSFPALASIMPQLVRRDQLQQANALMSLSRGGLTILGPTISALLVVTVGAGWALAVDAATWLASAVLLLRVRIPAKERDPDAQTSTAWNDLREGWTLFRSTTWLWVVVLAFGFLNAIHTGAWYTLGPVVAEQTIGKQGWGFVLSAESVGLLVMTVVLLRVPLKRPLLVGMAAIAFEALPLLLLGIDPVLVVLVVATFLGGVGSATFGIGWDLSMQEHIDQTMLSRAYSYDALGSFVAMPIGQLVAGPLGAAFGFRDVLVVGGISYAAICLLTLASRSVRTLRRAPAAPEPVTAA
ncbi:MAG TPA: MFS transporter [Nocardioidaceae bacterium]|nr:MFS transporter [Nocardioidaceae bacterium]